MPTVYQVQAAGFFDKNRGEYVYLDTSDAEQYGEVVTILEEPNAPYEQVPSKLVELLHAELDDFVEEDYLLLSGSPTAICIAGAIAACATDGNFKILQWDKRLNMYKVINVEGA